ncbi:MAG: ferritin family protein [Eisenbergiella sp.]
MDFKKSETYKNLKKAYDGELLAGTKYRIYSRIANKDGFRQIGNIFEETAKNEQEHAEIWLHMMNEASAYAG